MNQHTPQQPRSYALAVLIVLYLDAQGVQRQRPMNLMVDIPLGQLGIVAISMMQNTAAERLAKEMPDSQIHVTDVVLTGLIPMGSLTPSELKHAQKLTH